MTEVRSNARILLALSALLFAKQLWVLGMWIRAAGIGQTQAESVAIFLDGFPHGLAELGAFRITWIMIAVGVVGAVSAVPARRLEGWWKAAAIAMISLNSLMVLWYLFTLM